MFNGMMKSEIKKAETAANKFFGRNDCKVTGYYAKPSDHSEGWYEIQCEICFGYEERAEHDVIVSAMMFDRRRSFATVKTW
jgi:uncharacterized membrane protein